MHVDLLKTNGSLIMFRYFLEMMAFASFETMARRKSRSESFGKSSFNAKAGGSSAPDGEHRHPDISASLVDQMVKRLSSVGSVEGSDDGKGMNLKDLMQYYADKDDAGSNNSATIVSNLNWKGIGMYTGQVNEKIEPHGQGKLVMHDGATLYGLWDNGNPLTNDGSVSQSSEQNDTKKSPTKQEHHIGDKTASNDMPNYKLGDEGRRRDMIKDEDKDAAIERISKLKKNDAAFIRRTNGVWTFSRCKKISKDVAYFVVNSSGSTKSYKTKYWHSHIRACKIPAEKLPRVAPKRQSSNESLMSCMSDSDLSELGKMLQQPMLEELPPEKSSTTSRTFEIKEIREYEPTKNRFSIKDLMKPPTPKEPSQLSNQDRKSQSNDVSGGVSNDTGKRCKRGSTIDTSESSRDTTQDDYSVNKSLLRKGRFSFHEDGRYVSMKRNVSFSEEWETRSYIKDVPDDISTKTEDENDEDDNFDVNGTLSSNRAGEYNLRGIEP